MSAPDDAPEPAPKNPSCGWGGYTCCTNQLKAEASLSGTDLSQGFRDGDAERGEAVQDGNADLELGDLTVELARGQALAQELDTVHLGLGAASAVVSAPSSPDCPAETFRSAQDLVTGDRPGGVWLPWFGILARWDDRSRTPGGDGVMALAG
jgi:hypothetical protein